MRPHNKNSAFTLIELLVVIAIIAILAVVVILTLNPGEIMREAQDSNRLSDLSTFQSAMNVYTADAAIGGGSPNLGTPGTIYISIPDPSATSSAGTNCSALGFPSTGYHCAGPTYYRDTNGTGWVPINFSSLSSDPLGQLPADPTNTSSSNDYYAYTTNGTQWAMSAVPASTKYASQASAFTVGSDPSLLGGTAWVSVPGNSQFGTQNFLVMKYDASCVNLSTGQPLTAPLDSSVVNAYNNGSQNCTAANNAAPASIATGYPIVDISQTQAAAECQAIGAHLITNNEWQTIAWNAENVASNWSGGSVGSGALYSGHNDNVPANASLPSPTDSQSCVGTDGPTSCGGTGTATSQIRTLTLSNGSIIWDMAGNLWQWTNDTITGTNEPNSGVAGWSYIQYPAVTTWGTMSQSTAGPMNPTWSSTQGIGDLYAESATDATVYGFRRGGGWSDAGSAGVGTLALNIVPGTLSYIGFRCVR
ncbi:MAG: type II secretion system protein [Acidobacteriota bacterium]